MHSRRSNMTIMKIREAMKFNENEKIIIRLHVH